VTISALLAHLDAAGITLSLHLKVNGPQSAVTPDLLAVLAAHKPALLRRLAGVNVPDHSADPSAQDPLAAAPAPSDPESGTVEASSSTCTPSREPAADGECVAWLRQRLREGPANGSPDGPLWMEGEAAGYSPQAVCLAVTALGAVIEDRDGGEWVGLPP
jgi:hypothetical protein